jgi:hypothetical protein
VWVVYFEMKAGLKLLGSSDLPNIWLLSSMALQAQATMPGCLVYILIPRFNEDQIVMVSMNEGQKGMI